MIKVCFVQNELMPALDVFRTSQHQVISMRHSQQSEEALAEVHRCCQALITSPLLAGHGAGAFEFTKSAEGMPLLVSIEVGFGLEHFPVLFGRRWAPKDRILCWCFTPSEDLDVWTAWYVVRLRVGLCDVLLVCFDLKCH